MIRLRGIQLTSADTATKRPTSLWLLKASTTVLKPVLLVAVAVFLFNQLSEIGGLRQVLTSLPDQPVFYLLVGLHFMLIPAVELVIFAPLWQDSKIGAASYFRTFLCKQALNDTVIGYSGDAYLLWWGRQRLSLDARWVFHTVKDTTLLSAACSSLITLLVASGLYALGYLDPLLSGLPNAIPLLFAGIGTGAVIIPVLALFGRKILGLPINQVRRVCQLHAARQIISETLLILQWSIVLPGVPLSIWFGLSAARMVVTRIPMMPNKELTMLALALGLGQQLGEMIPSVSALAALFLARAAVIQLSNAGVLIGSSASLLQFRVAASNEAGDGETAAPHVPDQLAEPSSPVHSSE